MVQTIGLDLGSQKTVIVADDGDLVLTDTGSISRPTLVAFYGRSRLVGEEAQPQIGGDGAVPMLNALLGRSVDDLQASVVTPHRKVPFHADADGRLCATVEYCNEKKTLHATALVGMFLAKTAARVYDVYAQQKDALHFTFALPPDHKPAAARALKEACSIAGIDLSRVAVVDAADGLVAAYARKLSALKGPEKANVEGKKVLLVEMGHTQSTAVVVDVGSFVEGSEGPKKAAHAHDGELGALHFDLQLFAHFAGICQQKGGDAVVPGSKRGQRLLAGCERLRKLLSQLGESSVTVENMADAGDVSFSLKRDDLTAMCADLLARFKALLGKALAAAGAVDESGKAQVAAVEVLGGGVRMQVVQAAIHAVVGDHLPLGAKLDDASTALGCALVSNQRAAAGTAAPDPAWSEAEAAAVGLTADELAAARTEELEMQGRDAEITLLLAARNELESYLLETRAIPRRKHGNTVDAAALNGLLDDVENWLWDTPEAPLHEIQEKGAALKGQVAGLCADFVRKTEEDRVAVEEQLAAEAKRAEEERAANGEDDEDNDNRKLKKADRMRLVVKNKDEGTELFKGGVFKNAAARYHKALSHATKFFDLDPEGEKEVKALKTSLYLNLASCYIKMENWDQVIRNCEYAIELDAANPKAYFRRSAAYEAKKDWDAALADAKRAQELTDVEDKLLTKAVDRIKKEIAKIKEKEKKAYGKMFG